MLVIICMSGPLADQSVADQSVADQSGVPDWSFLSGW